jgi:probable F420-dependent oxidoreductase
MDLGVSLPTYNSPLTSPEAILRIAQDAEQLGYTAVWTYERLLYPLRDIAQPLPEGYATAYDPIETLAYVASKTVRIKLGTSVVNALFHVPVVLARRFATLDQFSHGRVIAGLGQGWMEQEFRTANISPKRRGAGFEEFIAAMRAAWGPDPVRFEGRFYHIPESKINPKPVQVGGPPILLGAFTPPAIERAARIADGINPVVMSFESLEDMATSFRSAAQAAGRNPSALKIMVRVNAPIAPKALPEHQRPFLHGSPDQIARDLRKLETLRIDHVFFATGHSASLDDEARLMERLQGAVQ